MSKKYMLLCNNCNYKKITDAEGVQKLYEYPQNIIQRGMPTKTPDGKIEAAGTLPTKRKFRCEKCGRAIIVREIADVQEKLNEKLELERRTKEMDDEKNRISGHQDSSQGFKIP